ncbi:hypothetical protein [Ancylobacter polymorphus]|uniref:Uncharacterized protein n=1 Tax=Ancylobacter polymorphus TaxID=223390 RepID=A0ABU0BEL7_9HYPH|nr:hypothetical protein [Ancylobacter polymorphus]MDQ0302919.1 hypothetical protein [Ancylobacter polymorphus]
MGSDAVLYGQKIVTSPYLTVTVEDWTGVRSPSRAIRRRRQGHRQNVVHRIVPDPKAYLIGGVFHMHPDMLAEVQRRAATRAALPQEEQE